MRLNANSSSSDSMRSQVRLRRPISDFFCRHVRTSGANGVTRQLVAVLALMVFHPQEQSKVIAQKLGGNTIIRSQELTEALMHSIDVVDVIGAHHAGFLGSRLGFRNRGENYMLALVVSR